MPRLSRSPAQPVHHRLGPGLQRWCHRRRVDSGGRVLPNLLVLAALRVNLTYSAVISDATQLSASLPPCPDGHYHHLALCLPCFPCAQNQSKLSPCTQTADRICNRTLVISLEILCANGINLGLLDLSRLAQGLVYTSA